jgi:hypothetical protein
MLIKKMVHLFFVDELRTIGQLFNHSIHWNWIFEDAIDRVLMTMCGHVDVLGENAEDRTPRL